MDAADEGYLVQFNEVVDGHDDGFVVDDVPYGSVEEVVSKPVRSNCSALGNVDASTGTQAARASVARSRVVR